MSVDVTHAPIHETAPVVTAARWPVVGQDRPEIPGAHATMRHVTVKAGHVAGRHHHDFEQFLCVVSGSATLQCEQGTIPLEPGTGLHLQPGAWHSAEFETETVLLEVNVDRPAP